jgi:RHS repeat-associated protein
VLSTLGPQHTVKLASGAQVQARSHTVYSYDEGAPAEGGPYHLVTKTTVGAQYEGKEADVHTTLTYYSGQGDLGWKLRKPTATTTDPGELKLAHTISYEASTGDVTETTTPAGVTGNQTPEYLSSFGSATEFGSEGEGPDDVALDSKGDVWVTDWATGHLLEYNEKDEYLKSVGSSGTRPYGLAIDAKGDVWVVDWALGHLQEFNEKGESLKTVGSEGSGEGQFKDPEGIAIDSKGNIWVTDRGNSRIEELNENGEFVKAFGTRGSEPGQLEEPEGIAIDSKGDIWVTDWYNERVEEYNAKGEYVSEFGTLGSENGQLKRPYGITIDSYGDVWVGDTGNSRVEEFNEKGQYLNKFGSSGSGPGQFNFGFPMGMAINDKDELFVTDKRNQRIEKWTIPAAGEDGAHTTQTVYYSTAANSKYPGCGGHPEWANLPCQTQPAKQPETSGLPNLPVTKYNEYNMFDEPIKETETVGSATRTAAMTYDAAGRALTSEATSSEGKALPKVTDKYSETTGQVVEQSTTSGSETKTIASRYNTLGQLTAYTDADENATTYEYEGEGSYKGANELDGRLRQVSDGKGTRVYTYEEATGALKELVDTQGAHVLTFSAAYDVEGNMTSESYPNNMTATYARNAAGEPTGIEYVKNSDCATTCPETWFNDSITPSIHGQALEQASSLAKDSYTYDEAGRLTQVQETPTGEGCTTRVYGYEADTNRTSLTTAKPNSKGECTSEGASEEKHGYDSADRLTDSGIKYNEFGDITTLPAADAGGYELSSSFYVDGQLEGQTQNGQSNTYELDPEHRTRETIAGTTATITHYAGPGDTPSWTVEPVSGHWSRYVQGIGGLAAIETSSSEPELQLTDLHGNVVAKASASETATKLLSSERSTEYGVPTTTKPAKYGWLGSDLNATELPSGVVAMGARSYVPQIGRFLQTDPVSGGSANAYAYTYGDPVDTSDPSGEYTAQFDGAGGEVAAGVGAALVAERKAAEEAAARAVAEKEAEEAAFWTHLMEPKGSELPEPPEPVPSAVYIVNEEEGSYGGAGVVKPGLIDCAGGCHSTPQQEKCLKKAGDNKSQAGKCFPKGNWKEVVGVVKETVGILKCAYEIWEAVPNCGSA